MDRLVAVKDQHAWFLGFPRDHDVRDQDKTKECQGQDRVQALIIAFLRSFAPHQANVSHAKMGQVMTSGNWPSGNVVAVPVGVNVDPAHTHVLLFALIGVDVVVSQNDAPSPGAVGGQNAEMLYFFTHAFALGAQ